MIDKYNKSIDMELIEDIKQSVNSNKDVTKLIDEYIALRYMIQDSTTLMGYQSSVRKSDYRLEKAKDELKKAKKIESTKDLIADYVNDFLSLISMSYKKKIELDLNKKVLRN
ncbi:MAG: hypothetical protein PUE27_09140 [Sharpea porci]|uniref:hypothetical protein n=1 Tax=Sharpea porci TaxID=2652286 RepID=UPI0024090DC5|nr:hypothetical protein [Sharpea porci]MDD6712230.1 hypothetical protein [Sharpea porci]